MKRISNLLFTITALLFVAVCVNAQTPPAAISIGSEADALMTRFAGGSVTEIDYNFSGVLPQVNATPDVGQSVFITQPTDGGKGIIEVRSSADGSLLSTYTINFVREDVCLTTLAGISIGGVAVDAFMPSKYDYSFVLPEGTSVIPSVSYVLSETLNPSAVSVVETASPFADGGEVWLTVSSAGAKTHAYVIHLSVPKRSNSLLGEVRVNGMAQVFADKGSGVYEFVSADPIVSVDYDKADASQTVRFVEQSRELVSLQVMAEDGSSTLYNITYGSTLSKELGITIDVDNSKVVDPHTAVLSQSNPTASFTLKRDIVDFPTIAVSKNDPNQEVFVSYQPKENKALIYVTAQNGEQAVYEISYVVDLSDDATLYGVEIDGAAYPFNSAQFEYTYAGTHAVTGWTKTSPQSNVTLLQTDTVARLVVTAADGVTQHTYTFHFPGGGTAASINNIYADGSLMSAPYEYPYTDLASVPEITADVTGNSYFVLQQGAAGADVVAFGTSSAPVAEHINAVTSLSSDATLSKLQFYHYDAVTPAWEDIAVPITDMSPMPCPFVLASEKSELPAIYAEPTDDGATVQTVYDFSAHQATIHVTAEDGLSVADYVVTFDYNVSTENKLGSLTIDGVSQDVTKSSFSISVDGALPVAKWTRAEDTQIVNVVDEDYDGMTITVVPESGSARDYKISYAAKGLSEMSENVLQSLSINGVSQDLTMLGATGDNKVPTSGQAITTDLDLAYTKNYASQIVVVTNYGGYLDASHNPQVSTIELAGGEYEQVYQIPVTSIAVPPVDCGAGCADFELFINGIDESAHVNDGSYTYECAYGTLSMPDIEIRAKSNGQIINVEKTKLSQYQLPNRIAGNYNKVTITVTNGLSTKILEVKFVKSAGSGTDVDLAAMTINGNAYALVDGAVYDLAEDYVPFVEFEKKVGQVVEMTLTKVNAWQYSLEFVITSADKSDTKTYTMTLNLPYADSEGRLDDIVGLAGFSNMTDGGTYTLDADGNWPMWNFFRKVVYDGVEQIVSADQVIWNVTGRGGMTQTYTINYTSVSNNTDLGGVTLDGNAMTVSDVMDEMSVAEPSAVVITIAEEGQTVVVGKSANPNEYIITVTAPNGVDTKDYTLKINRAKSNNNKLIDLAYATGLNNTFDPELSFYEGVGTPDLPKWLAPDVEDMVATYYPSEKVEFTYVACDPMNSPARQVFKVTPEDESAALEYYIDVINGMSSYALLENVAINGIPVAGFDPMVEDYTGSPIDVAAGEDVDVQYSTLDAFQTINVSKSKTSVTIQVRSEDGTDQREYRFAINHPADESDAKLAELLIDGANVLVTDQYGYPVTIPLDGKLPDIRPIAGAAGQTITMVADDVQATITVAAPDQVTTLTYIVSFNYQADDEVHLYAIMIDSVPELLDPIAFNPASISRASSDAPVIDFIKMRPAQTVTVSGNQLHVVSASGSVQADYNLTFDLGALDNDAELQELNVTGIGDIVGGIFPYAIKNCDLKDIVDIRAVLKNEFQTLDWNVTMPGATPNIASEITATVHSQKGEAKEYKIIVYSDDNADLADIRVKNRGSLTTADVVYTSEDDFDPAIHKYMIRVNEHSGAFEDIEFEAANTCQVLDVQKYETPDSILWVAEVTAKSGKVAHDSVILKCNETRLDVIYMTIDGVKTPIVVGDNVQYQILNPLTLSYTIHFKSPDAEIPQVSALDWDLSCADHEKAEITYSDYSELYAEYHIQTTSQFGEHKIYTIIFEKELQSDNELAMIYVDTLLVGTHPLKTSNTIFDIPADFVSANPGPYYVNMHKGHQFDTLPVAEGVWPKVSWLAPEFATVDSVWSIVNHTTDYDQRTLTITVHPQDIAVPNMEYEIIFTNPICTHNELTNIYLDGVALGADPNYVPDVPFAPTQNDYQITMPLGWLEDKLPTTITYDIFCKRENVVAESWTAMTADYAEYSIEVISESGDTRIYTLRFNYNKSVCHELNHVYFNGTEYTSFDPYTDYYIINLDICTEHPDPSIITYDKCDEWAEVSAITTEYQDALKNILRYSITVTAQNGNSTTYNFDVYKTPTTDSDAEISMIRLNGLDINNFVDDSNNPIVFTSSVADYTVLLPVGTATFPTVEAITLANQTATVVDQPIDEANNSRLSVISVESCDGVGTMTYNVNVIIDRSSNANAEKLLVNSADYPGDASTSAPSVFDPANDMYVITYNAQAINNNGLTFPKVELVPEDSRSTSTIKSGFSTPLIRKDTLFVTAEDGTVGNNYYVNVVMEPNANNQIEGINVGGEAIGTSAVYVTNPANDVFSAVKNNYTVLLNAHAAVWPAVEFVTDNNKYQILSTDYDYSATDSHIDRITVKSQQDELLGNSTVNIYTVTTVRQSCYLHMLKEFTINGIDVLSLTDTDPADDVWEAAYTVALPICTDISSLVVNAVPQCDVHSTASVNIAGPVYPAVLPAIAELDYTITVDIQNENGKQGKYILHLKAISSFSDDLANIRLQNTYETVDLSNAAFASSATMADYSVDYDFGASATDTYEVTLPIGTTVVPNVVAVGDNDCQTITVSTTELLDAFTYQTLVTVRPAYDHVSLTTRTYTVIFHVLPNTENRVRDISIDGQWYGESAAYVATPADFDPNQSKTNGGVEYTATFPAGVHPSQTVTFVLEDGTIQVGDVDINTSNPLMHVYTINTISEAGVANQYVLNLVYQLSDDAQLSSLMVNGDMLQIAHPLYPSDYDWNASWENYVVTLLPHTDNFPVITYTAPTGATVDHQINGTDADQQQVHTIKVTAENGLSSKTYQVTINKTECQYFLLNDIRLDNVSLAGFNPYTQSYVVDLTSGSPFPPEDSQFTWTQQCPKDLQNVTISHVDNGNFERVFTIRSVSHSNPSIFIEYKITVHLATDNDWKLTGIFADGELLSTAGPNYIADYDFNADRYQYTINLPEHSTYVPNITATTSSTVAQWDTASVWSADHFTRTTTITVTAENQVVKTYTVVCVLKQCSKDKLVDIKVNGVTVAGFDPDTYTYYVTLPANSQMLTVTWMEECPAHETVAMTQIPNGNFQATYTLTTQAENKSSKQYVVNVTITTSNDWLLKNITADGEVLSTTGVLYQSNHDFDPNTFGYEIYLPEHTPGFPTIKAETNSPLADTVITRTRLDNDSTLEVRIHTVAGNGDVSSPDYIVRVYKTKCGKKLLTGLFFNAMPVSVANGFDKDFNPALDNETYSIVLPKGSDISATDVTYTLECNDHEQALKTVNTLNTFSREFVITTVPQNGSKGMTYRVYVSVLTDNNCELLKITANGNVLSTADATYPSDYDFVASHINYTITVASHQPHPVVEATLVDPTLQTLNASMATKNNDSTRVYTFEVIASNPAYRKTYTVTVNLTKCTMNQLAGIYDGNGLIAGFDPNVYNYSFTLPAGSTAPTITAQAQCQLGHEKVDITTVNPTPFDYIYIITTTPQTGSQLNYQVTYTIEKSAIADLTMIYAQTQPLTCLSGCDILVDVAFNAALDTYNVSVPYGVTLTVADITADLLDPNASYVVVPTLTGFDIVVTAQDGVTTKTYHVNVTNRQSSDLTVTGIMVDHQPLAGFDPAVYTGYEVKIYHRSSQWILNPDSLDIQALGVIAPPASWSETREYVSDTTFRSIVRITAEDNTFVEYEIKILQVLSHNALLASLNVDNFDPNTFSYIDTIPYGDPIPTLVYQGAEPYYQTITANPSSDITQVATITVVAEDGINTNTYTIAYRYDIPSSNALLATLSTNDASVLQPEFEPEIFRYIAVFPSETDEHVLPVHVSYAAQDPFATTEVLRWASAVGDSTIIRVTAQDGVTQNTYVVIYTIQGIGNADLCDLGFLGDGTVAHFDEGTIDGFEPQTTLYYDTLENASVDYLLDESRVSIIATPCDPEAIVENVERLQTNTNDVQINVTVRSADLVTTKTYTVNVHIVTSTNAYLDMIIINGEPLTNTDCDADFSINQPFQPEVTYYEIAVAQDIPLDGTWTLDYIFGNAQQQIASVATNVFGEELIQVVFVKAGAGNLQTYELRFHHKTSYAYLDDIQYNGVTIADFYPEADELTVYCLYGESSTFTTDMLTYTLGESRQNVMIDQVSPTRILITVTADDCSQHIYQLDLQELDYNSALLRDLQVDYRTIVDFEPEGFYYDYFLLNEDDQLPDGIVGVPFDSLATVEYEYSYVEGGVYLTITVTDRAELSSNQYIVFFQPVPYDINSRAEVWDVGVVHMGGDTYKLASHKSNVQFAVYDTDGYLVQIVSVKVIDPNQSVDDISSDGTYITVPADKLWIYCFYQNGQYRVERGKLMHNQ